MSRFLFSRRQARTPGGSRKRVSDGNIFRAQVPARVQSANRLWPGGIRAEDDGGPERKKDLVGVAPRKTQRESPGGGGMGRCHVASENPYLSKGRHSWCGTSS